LPSVRLSAETSFRRILEGTEKRVPDCSRYVLDQPSDARLTRVVCWDEDLRFAGVQSAAECGSEAPNGGRFVVEIVLKLYETQSRRLETTNFVGCKRPRHQPFFLVRVSPACNHQQEPARCDEVCNPDDRPLSFGGRQDLQGV
jgi:hypothetical protein